MQLDDIADAQVIKFAQAWKEANAAGRTAPCVLDALVKTHGKQHAELCSRKIERLIARELLQYGRSRDCAWPTELGLGLLEGFAPAS